MATRMAEPSHSSIIPMPPEERTAAPPQPLAYPWTSAEKYLNYFVGAVALMERVGNCLGTLAFTWATVVVLGGFSTNLGQDFWYATAIVFLEAFRVFSRESRSDDELLFRTRGSIRLKRMRLSRGIPYYLTVSIVIVCMYGTLEFSLRHYGYSPPQHYRLQYHILLLAVLLALASFAQAPVAAQYLKDHTWLQFISAFLAVLALGIAMLWSHTRKREMVLIIPPLFVGCVQIVFKDVGVCLGKICNLGLLYKIRDWLGALVSLILPAWIVISVLLEFGSMGILILLGTLLLGNIQIPVAVARIVLSAVRLSSNHGSRNDGNEHLAPALTIFYSMVLAQGLLYLAACIFESLLSSHFRRALANSSGLLKYRQGYGSIDLYYEYAYNKRMQEGVLAQEDMSRLVTFALDSLDSNSNGKKLAAVKILHSLFTQLKFKGASDARLVSEITASTKVVASLINMLGWKAASDDDDERQGIKIRWFTANVIAYLARDLRIVGILGTMQMVSLLLDVDAKNKEAKQDISKQKFENNELSINDNQQRNQASSTSVDIQGEHGYHAPTNRQELSEQGGKKIQNSNKLLDCMNNMLSSPEDQGEDPPTDMETFPILGMQILERLAGDVENCAEISKAIGLVPKIIGFIINTTDTTNNIMTSSLKLIAKLVVTEGEVGTKIRQTILDEHFFLSNLVEILVDTNSRTEQWKSTMVIMAKIILEDEISKDDVQRFHVIIPELIHAFLRPDESSNTNDYDCLLRTLAGEALSKLIAQNNSSICMDILKEKGYGLIIDLENMLQRDEYTYVAANLLRNLCEDSKYMLQHSRPSEQLSSILHLVLEKIMYSEGKRLQVLIITASQLHNLIPIQFAYELESCTNKENFVQKLVNALNSNRKMCHECPEMRKVIVDIAISIMESCPQYSPIFKSKRMMEALSKIQRIYAKVEKYNAFLGDARDVFDNCLPPQDLVTKAKQLLGSETPNQEANVQGSLLDIVHVD